MQRYGPLTHCRPSDHCVGSCWAIVEFHMWGILPSDFFCSCWFSELERRKMKWRESPWPEWLERRFLWGQFSQTSMEKWVHGGRLRVSRFLKMRAFLCHSPNRSVGSVYKRNGQVADWAFFCLNPTDILNFIKVWGSFHSCTATSATKNFEFFNNYNYGLQYDKLH